MTNREWLNSLSDLKFAAWMRNEFSLTADEYLDLVDWLKQEHPDWHRESYYKLEPRGCGATDPLAYILED